MYWATDPSLVTRAAFLAATETPFLRRTTTACSMSPLASVRACLQSIIGAPVFSRSSFTCVAEIFIVDVLIAMNSLRYRRNVACYVLLARRRRCKQRLYSYFVSTNFDPRRTTRAGLNPSGAKARNLICEA